MGTALKLNTLAAKPTTSATSRGKTELNYIVACYYMTPFLLFACSVLIIPPYLYPEVFECSSSVT